MHGISTKLKRLVPQTVIILSVSSFVLTSAASAEQTSPAFDNLRQPLHNLIFGAFDPKKGDAETLLGYIEAYAQADVGMFPNLQKGQEDVARIDAFKDAVAAPLAQSFQEKQTGTLENVIAAGAESFAFTATKPGHSNALFDHYVTASDMVLQGRDAILADIDQLHAQFAAVEDVDVTALSVDDSGAIRTRLTVKGATSQGSRAEYRAELMITVDGAYKITDMTLVRGEYLVAKTNNYFTAVHTDLDLGEHQDAIRWEAIRRGGYALATHDYNNDGLVDVYVGGADAGVLLKNTGNGFENVTQAVGLGNDELVKSAVFADFNNDGIDDLFLVRFEYSPEKQMVMYEGKQNGTFALVKTFEIPFIEQYQLPMPVAVGNFNDDDLLDIYIGFPGKLDFTTMNFEAEIMQEHRKYKVTGEPQGLFVNEGNFVFSDKTDYALYEGESPEDPSFTEGIFPHAALAADLNGDALQDIIVVDDREHASLIFVNDGDGSFTQQPTILDRVNSKWGMSVAAGDYDNDGHTDLFFTAVDFPELFSYNNGLGNLLYRNNGDGTFSEVTEAAGIPLSHQASAGTAFIDIDNDGDLDLYVANGLWSGPHEDAEDLSRYFVPAFMNSKDVHLEASYAVFTRGILADGQLVMSVLKHVLGEDGLPRFSFAGHQRNELYINNGDGTFTEAGYLLGVDSLSDGYMVSEVDLNNDGALDLVLRNADPGTKEARFPVVEMLQNNISVGNYLRLTLEGTASNRDAIGAQVTITTENGTQTRELYGNNGAVQSERLIHFGLGNATTVDTLTVRWPSGAVETLTNIQAGEYALTEGGVLR